MGLDVDEVIAHAVAYDPVARRNRYLRDRKLKGRRKGPIVTPGPPKIGVGSRVVESGNANSALHPPVNRSKQAQEASNARQISALKGRLSKLKAHLNELLAKKKAESKSSTSSDSSKSDSKDAKSGTTEKTAKQKEAAKEAIKKAQKASAEKKKREPNQPSGGSSLSLDEQITKTRTVINQTETLLRAAIDSART